MPKIAFVVGYDQPQAHKSTCSKTLWEHLVCGSTTGYDLLFPLFPKLKIVLGTLKYIYSKKLAVVVPMFPDILGFCGWVTPSFFPYICTLGGASAHCSRKFWELGNIEELTARTAKDSTIGLGTLLRTAGTLFANPLVLNNLSVPELLRYRTGTVLESHNTCGLGGLPATRVVLMWSGRGCPLNYTATRSRGTQGRGLSASVPATTGVVR